MKALISTIEPVQSGYRVAQVVQDSDIFDVAVDFFWVDCSDNVIKDEYWYDPLEGTIKECPIPQVQTQKSSEQIIQEINERIAKLKELGINLST